MQYDRLTKGVAAVFGVLTAALTLVGLLTSPAVLFLAVMFGASTYLMYYHISGKMAASVYNRVEQRAATEARARRGDGRGGFGAGPREEWEPPRDGRGRRTSERARQERQRAQQGRRRVRQSSGPSQAEAYNRLGLDPSADERAVKDAYRERVKETHPDTDSGSEREFKRVKAAYETLTDD